MSPNINIRWLIGSIMIFMLPVIINAQEQDREQVLLVDIDSLVTRAVRDRIITKEESRELFDDAGYIDIRTSISEDNHNSLSHMSLVLHLNVA